MTKLFSLGVKKLWRRLTYAVLTRPDGVPPDGPRTVIVAPKRTSEETFTPGISTLSRYAPSGLLVACVLSWVLPCAAQEVDVPTGRGNGSITAPTGWVELITPLRQRVELKTYGFYVGDLKAPSAQVDATIRLSRFLSVTPSYLYYSVPASGLDELANVSRGFTHRYEEHQFRIDGTAMMSIHKFEISERNMYVARILPTYSYAGQSLPDKEINRYRNRIAVSHPMTVKEHTVKPFASYEVFYDQGSGWTKKRVWSGVTVPLAQYVSFQPSYMWERTNGIKDLNYVMFGLIFRASSSR